MLDCVVVALGPRVALPCQTAAGRGLCIDSATEGNCRPDDGRVVVHEYSIKTYYLAKSPSDSDGSTSSESQDVSRET